MTTLFSNTGKGLALAAITGTTRYLALFTTAPNELGIGGVEVSAPWYARQTMDAADWLQQAGAISSTTMTIVNRNAVAFPAVTGSAVTIRGWGIYDAATGGNLIAFGDSTSLAGNPFDVTIPIGGVPTFQIGALQVGIGAQTFIANPAEGNAIRVWQPDTWYEAGQYVDYSNQLYKRNVSGTSGSSFNPGDWTEVSPSTGVTEITTSTADNTPGFDIVIGADTIGSAFIRLQTTHSSGATTTYEIVMSCDGVGGGIHTVVTPSSNPVPEFAMSAVVSGGNLILRLVGSGTGTSTTIKYRVKDSIAR